MYGHWKHPSGLEDVRRLRPRKVLFVHRALRATSRHEALGSPEARIAYKLAR